MPHALGLPKHIKPSLLAIPTFKGVNPPKMKKFADEVFKRNENQPALLTTDNFEVAAAYYSSKCHPHNYHSFMKSVRKQSLYISERCHEIQKQERDRLKTLEDEEGAIDKPLKLPNYSDIRYEKLNYAWFVDRLSNLNPDRIIDRPLADSTIQSEYPRLVRKMAPQGRKQLTERDVCRRFLGKVSDDYWARKKAQGLDDAGFNA